MNQLDIEAVTKEIEAEIIPVLDEIIEEIIEPLEDFGNPEKLIGKPYETWGEPELAVLESIYGPGDTVLSKFLFNKEYKHLMDLEKGVGNG